MEATRVHPAHEVPPSRISRPRVCKIVSLDEYRRLYPERSSAVARAASKANRRLIAEARRRIGARPVDSFVCPKRTPRLLEWFSILSIAVVLGGAALLQNLRHSPMPAAQNLH